LSDSTAFFELVVVAPLDADSWYGISNTLHDGGLFLVRRDDAREEIVSLLPSSGRRQLQVEHMLAGQHRQPMLPLVFAAGRFTWYVVQGRKFTNPEGCVVDAGNAELSMESVPTFVPDRVSRLPGPAVVKPVSPRRAPSRARRYR